MCPNIAGTTLGNEVNKTDKTVDSLASWKWRQPYKQTIIVKSYWCNHEKYI